MPRPWLPYVLAGPALLALGHVFAPQTAAACGGTFCDGGVGMPVDQTGETIVFAQGGGFVEAHVQINYDGGNAEDFSWIVPVPVEPEIGVGSLDFINALRAATVPTYGITTGTNECPSATGIGFISDPDGGGATGEPDPEVLQLSTAGAFEFVVLQGGTSATMMQWLDDNGYAPNPLAPELFDAYIEEGSVFVAFRLRHNAGIEDLHPIVIRYEGTEPCIPIRLTAVAAQPNMDIRALFLGEDRVLPTNYRHVRLNDLRLDWLQRAPAYTSAVAAALDEAGGRAFVTEYAGDSSVVDPTTIDTTPLDPTAFEGIDPLTVVNVLQAQGLVDCTESCGYRHELVPLLLREFLPPPKGIDADVFYACPSCYERLADTSAWDEAAFIERYREYVLDPRAHAEDLLETWPYLTRLYSRLSPSEMTIDPMFAEVEGLPAVPNVLGAQRNSDACCEDTIVLPDGANVLIQGGAWPSWSGEMPYAAQIQQYQPGGPPANEIDNVDAINEQLTAHNNYVASTRDCEGTGTGTGTGGDPGEGSGGVPPATTGTPPTTTGPGGGQDTTEPGTTSGSGSGGLDDDGGCRTGHSERGWLALLLGFGLATLRRRRR